MDIKQTPIKSDNLNPSTIPQVESQLDSEIRVNNLELLMNIIESDLDIASYVVKRLLDKTDPKKVCQLVKAGFDMKISEMQQSYTEMQWDLHNKVEEGKMSNGERLIRLKNLDGNIRSMLWFLSNIS